MSVSAPPLVRASLRVLLRAFVLASLIAFPGPLAAQNAPSMTVERLTDDLSKITVSGGWDATVVAFTGPDGLLVVDSGFKDAADELMATLLALGHGSPRYLINTHSHKDHTGGNSVLGHGATVVAHHGMAEKLEMGSLVLEDYTADALPDIGIEDETVLFFNDEEVRIKTFPGGHDVTDLIVWFEDAGVAYLGDLAYGMHFPSTDYYTGSLPRYPDVISAILEYLPPETRIVSGHGRDYSYQEMTQFRDMLVESQAIIAEQFRMGLSAEEIVGGGFLDPWESYTYPGMTNAQGYVVTTIRNLQDSAMPTENILGALYRVAQTGDGEAVYREYQRIRASEADAYGLTDPGFADIVIGHLFSLGSRLLNDRRYEVAVRVFDILVGDYPDLRGKQVLYNSMGEAYLHLFDFQAATESFEKALEFAPDHENAMARLELLRGRGR